nr:unnamed protein product [Callosobruchus chinensis]
MLKKCITVLFDICVLLIFVSRGIHSVLLTESGQEDVVVWYQESLEKLDADGSLETITIQINSSEAEIDKICDALSSGGSIFLDLTWGGNEEAKELSNTLSLPYIRIDVSISPFLEFLDKFLDVRNATDVALVFSDSSHIDQALYYWIETTKLRLMISESLDPITARKLKHIRPTPNNIAVLGSTKRLIEEYTKVMFIWTKAHSGRTHNEVVDNLAKASVNNIDLSTQALCISDCINLVKKNTRNEWATIYHQYCANNLTQYARIQEDLPKQPWFYDLTVSRRYACQKQFLDNLISDGLRPPFNVTYLLAINDKNALQYDLIQHPDRVNMVFTDFKDSDFDRALLRGSPVHLLILNPSMCCSLLNSQEHCECPSDMDIQKTFLTHCLQLVYKTIQNINQEKLEFEPVKCNSTSNNNEVLQRFEEIFENFINDQNLIKKENYTIKLALSGIIEMGTNNSADVVAMYEDGIVTAAENKSIKAIKPFYRIGITNALPWSYKEKDSITGKYYWTGYCADFARKIAEMMDFNFEFVEPKVGTFGEKIDGVWNGVIGDLAAGVIMRKPIRKTSLFKFMTVLKLEVWLSIVAALIVTGFMVWFLDKYSPYSARNNKEAYPYECREFTLKESFWFALTSFTPQGGGEAPKALSGRTLVAAYWLFVVLMLATFTANLAAFLTVERMQAPVQSLEQLARQSRINYTVVRDSETHQYFINMKNAEDTLYRMWKELTLNASTDDTRYRVWDYPIREQYGHILLAINDSDPVADAEEGFRNVEMHLDADYAFIHDSSEIKYEISKNCNLTEVGEVFAEKPYAVAVQQVYLSSRKTDFSKTSKKAMVTLVGEVLYYRRKQKLDEANRRQQKPFYTSKGKLFTENIVPSKILVSQFQPKQLPVTIGTSFKPVNIKNLDIDKERSDMRISHINLYPRARSRITHISNN